MGKLEKRKVITTLKLKLILSIVFLLLFFSVASADIHVFYEPDADIEFLKSFGFKEIEHNVFVCSVAERDSKGNITGYGKIYIIVEEAYA